jgi:glycosyltransferase involved in cell wall biosynthesis
MKIAYLLGSLNRGGTETLLLDVFRNAVRNKLAAVGIYRKTGVLVQEFMGSGVPMQQIAMRRNVISYLLELRRFLRKEKVEVVHAQQAIDALYARIACMGTGKKILLTFHGYDFTDKALGRFIFRFIIKRTDLNLYVSDTQLEYYRKKYNLLPEKQQVVYNGISFSKLDMPIETEKIRGAILSHTPEIETLRTELKLSPDILLLGAVGNFNNVRDQLTICHFLKLLKEQGVDFHFVFAGKRVEGQEHLYDSCVDFCKSNGLSKYVSFLGVRNDVPAILHQLDAFVYSTSHDTFGIAVVEAMAVGIPVFVNDWGVMQEITDGGKQATLYKTRNEEDLLREFMLFLQDKEAYNTKAKQAATFVRGKYSIEKHIEKLKEVYKLMF